MRRLVFLILAGCWQSPASPPPGSPPEVVVQPEVPRPHRTTLWTGRYVCPQGITAISLTLASKDHAIDATFEFGPLPENPSVPHGSYTMHGVAKRLRDGEFAVVLEPDHWIEQPPGYLMVGLEATTSAEHRVLRGRITDARCAEIELSRLR